jgi:hypothetical protein
MQFGAVAVLWGSSLAWRTGSPENPCIFQGFYVETRNCGATAALWASLGFENVFDTDHGSGQWAHPGGGPYVFIAENGDLDAPLATHPILGVADATAFRPARPPEFFRDFEPQHWGVVEALLRDPDGREVSLQAPLPEGVTVSMDEHHAEKYG